MCTVHNEWSVSEAKQESKLTKKSSRKDLTVRGGGRDENARKSVSNVKVYQDLPLLSTFTYEQSKRREKSAQIYFDLLKDHLLCSFSQALFSRTPSTTAAYLKH